MPASVKLLKEKAYARLWHVYIKKTFKGSGQVVSYLGKYTHRVAIGNNRMVSGIREAVMENEHT
ncbi:hypothetical protein BH23BAC2_BH23BAC2_18980 [soil metagenome]